MGPISSGLLIPPCALGLPRVAVLCRTATLGGPNAQGGINRPLEMGPIRLHERGHRKLVEKCRQEAYDLVHQCTELPAIQVEGANVFCRR